MTARGAIVSQVMESATTLGGKVFSGRVEDCQLGYRLRECPECGALIDWTSAEDITYRCANGHETEVCDLEYLLEGGQGQFVFVFFPEEPEPAEELPPELAATRDLVKGLVQRFRSDPVLQQFREEV